MYKRQRILIECRLAEHGKKPYVDANGEVRWMKTSVWNYSDEGAFFTGLSKLFPGFAVVRKVGQSDKNRILLELSKQ